MRLLVLQGQLCTTHQRTKNRVVPSSYSFVDTNVYVYINYEQRVKIPTTKLFMKIGLLIRIFEDDLKLYKMKKIYLLLSFIFLLVSCAKDDEPNDVSSATIWNGEKITFTKIDGADPTDEANQDRINSKVWITRGNNGGQIYNIKTETNESKYSSPSGTEWSIGTTNVLSTLVFDNFRTAVSKPKNVVGKDLVLHLIEDDIYLDIKFTSWSQNKAGGFSYERSTQ